jgi:hypothetical protein
MKNEHVDTDLGQYRAAKALLALAQAEDRAAAAAASPGERARHAAARWMALQEMWRLLFSLPAKETLH